MNTDFHISLYKTAFDFKAQLDTITHNHKDRVMITVYNAQSNKYISYLWPLENKLSSFWRSTNNLLE